MAGYERDIDYLFENIIPRAHEEVADDWAPAFDYGADVPLANVQAFSEPAPTVQAPLAPRAPSGPNQVAAIGAGLPAAETIGSPAQAPTGQHLEQLDAQAAYVASQQAPQPEEGVSETATAQALDQMMSDAVPGDDEDLSQYLQGVAGGGQLQAEQQPQQPGGKPEVGGAKSMTEADYVQQSSDRALPVAISRGLIGALGEVFGSRAYRNRNQGWGRRAAGVMDDYIAHDRDIRTRDTAARNERNTQRASIEQRLGTEKQAAQLADPSSTQSRRLQNAYALRFAQSVPDADAGQIAQTLGGLAYSDEQTRSVVDDLLKAAQEARAQGRELQARELLAQMEAAVSLQRSAIAADGRLAVAEQRRPRAGGGRRTSGPITADWMLRREEELMALQGRNPYSGEQRAARLAEIQQLQAAAAGRDPAARSLWDKFAQTTEGEIRRLEAQSGTVDSTGVREHAAGARSVRSRLTDEQASEVAMALTGAARGGIEGWMQEHVGRAMADSDDPDVIEYSNHIASMRDALAHREFGASQTNGEARRLAQRLGGLGFRPSAAALDRWAQEAEAFLIRQEQRRSEERFRGTAAEQPAQAAQPAQGQAGRVRVRLRDGRTGTVPSNAIPEGATVIR